VEAQDMREPVQTSGKIDYLHILYDLVVTMHGLETMDEVLWTTAKRAIASLGLDDCVIYLTDSSGKNLIQRAAHGPKNPHGMSIKDPIVIRIGEGIVGGVAATGKYDIVVDTRQDPRYIVDDKQRFSEIAVPITHGDNVIGVIDSEHEKANFYNESHRDILLAIASVAATKIASLLLIEQLEAKEKELTFLAHHDPLTHLYNRRALLDRINKLLTTAKTRNRIGTLWFIDLDRFKLYNDRYGHIAGDQLLRRVAEFISVFASREKHVAARLGGDEFVIVFNDTAAKTTLQMCHQFIRGIKESLAVDASVGITEIDSGSISDLAILEVASLACHQAKTSGGCGFHLVSSDDDQYLLYSSQLSWASKIEKALAEDRMTLLAQPIIPLNGDGNRQRGNRCEILVRLRGEDGELVEAREFLVVAEQFGLMSKVDMWVLKNVLQWITDIPPAVRMERVHINVSGCSVSDETFADMFVSEISNSTVADRLCVEITETAAISNLVQATQFVRRLKSLGVEAAIDDFGTGFASFLLLRDLDCDVVKIDRAFVDPMHPDQNKKITRSINEVANSLGAVTVAEGIEDQRSLDMVSESGVAYGQGFYIGRPASLDNVCGEVIALEPEVATMDTEHQSNVVQFLAQDFQR
jgi:diguanylate cyclase (GGDEF)-like protein